MVAIDPDNPPPEEISDPRVDALIARGPKQDIINQIKLTRYALNTLLLMAAKDYGMTVEMGKSKFGMHIRIDGVEI